MTSRHTFPPPRPPSPHIQCAAGISLCAPERQTKRHHGHVPPTGAACLTTRRQRSCEGIGNMAPAPRARAATARCQILAADGPIIPAAPKRHPQSRAASSASRALASRRFACYSIFSFVLLAFSAACTLSRLERASSAAVSFFP